MRCTAPFTSTRTSGRASRTLSCDNLTSKGDSLDTPRASQVETIQLHSMARAIVLHLLPGALVTVFYILAAPLMRSLGFPSLAAIFLSIFVVLIPSELGYLLYQSRKEGTSLRGLLSYQEPVGRGQFIGIVVSLFLWASVCAVLLYPPLDLFFTGTVFSWIPGSFFLTEDFSRYSTAALATTWIFGLIFNGVAGPIVEELYFRGYLLPRLARLGAWAPLVNITLFSIYHFFTPWQTVGRIIALLPMVYTVWWKRNIRIGIIVHILGNISSMFLLLPALFG